MRPIHRLAPSSVVALATVVFFITSSSLPSVARAGTVQRSYSAGKYALQLGNDSSYVRSVDGGNVRGEVVTDPTGNKQIGRVVVEPIRAQIGNDDFTQFIQQSLADPGKSQSVDGAILALDYDGKLVSRRDFTHAVLTEVTFPEFNAASKDVAAITIGLVPESASDFKGGGMPSGIKGDAKTQQKKWMPANFRVKLGDMPTNRVTRIEAIKLARASGISDEGTGQTRVPEKAPGSGNWQVPNIVFYLNAVDALPYWKWAEDSLNKGNAGNEQTLTIDALDPTRKDVLLTLTCSGVGLVSAKMEPVAANADATRELRVEVYAEKIAIDVPKGPAAAAPDEKPNPGTDTGAGTGTAAAAGSASAAPAPAPAAINAPTAASEAATVAPTARKKRPAPAAVATAPTLTPLPAPTLTPAPAPSEPAPAPKPVRKSPRG